MQAKQVRKSDFSLFFLLLYLLCIFGIYYNVSARVGYIFTLFGISFFTVGLLLSNKIKRIKKGSPIIIYIGFILCRFFAALLSGNLFNLQKTNDIKIFYFEFLMISVCDIFLYNLEENNKKRILIFIRNAAVFISAVGVLEFILKRQLVSELIISKDSLIYFIGDVGSNRFRITSFFSHPIICGVYSVIFFIIVMYFPFENVWINFLSKGLILAVILGTQSRSSWISAVITLLLFYFRRNKTIDIKVKKKKILRIIIIIIIVVVLLVLSRDKIENLISVINYRLASTLNYDFIENNTRSQIIQWGFDIFRTSDIIRKLFGHGPNFFIDLLYYNPVNGSWTRAIDNQYLTILINYGMVSALYLIYFVGFVFFRFIKSKSIVVQCSSLCLLSIFISGFFYEYLTWPTVIIIQMILICLIEESEEKQSGSVKLITEQKFA